MGAHLPTAAAYLLFVGWKANLLMYLQESPRGDGAYDTSPDNPLSFYGMTPLRLF